YFTADLGAGNDVYAANIDNANFSASGEIHFDVNGGLGNNTMKVTRNGTTGDAIAAFAGLFDVRLKGGPGNDVLPGDLDKLFDYFGGAGYDGVYRVRLDGGAGNDTINLTTTIGAQALATAVGDVAVTGGPGNDVINVSYTNNSAFNDAANYGPAGRIV